MKIVLAPDSFKGTLRSIEVCDIEAQAIHEVMPEAQIVRLPLADGGEGTLDAIAHAQPNSRCITVPCHDPLGREIAAEYLLLPDGKTAVIELAQASGLQRLRPDEFNPLQASTFGTGEILRSVLDRGIRKLIVGLGGSATVDGGLGIAGALGLGFMSQEGSPLQLTIGQSFPTAPQNCSSMELLSRARITYLNKAATPLRPSYDLVELVIASDVTNPLLGPNGAATVFGPQKGATPEMVAQLEMALANWARLWQDDGTCPGDGAAGGVGFLLRKLFTHCKTESGGELVCRIAGLPAALADADLVITGEGASDSQTLGGKLPVVVSRHAGASGVPCALLSGYLPPQAKTSLAPYFQHMAGTTDKPLPPAELAHTDCKKRLANATKKFILTILDKT